MVTRREIEEFLEAEEKLGLGKVVFLCSGGPPMTISAIRRSKVTCEWFDRTDRYRSQEFFAHSLTGRKPLKDGRSAGLLVIGNLDTEPQTETSDEN